MSDKDSRTWVHKRTSKFIRVVEFHQKRKETKSMQCIFNIMANDELAKVFH